MLRDYVTFRTSHTRELPQGFRLMGEPRRISGAYEPEETALIANALDRADVFVDVGANIGYYTVMAAKRGLHVISFEPSTTTSRYLYANLLANGLDQVEVLPLAASDKVALAVIYGTGGTASLVAGWSRASEVYATVIPTTTLDHVLAGRFLDRRLFVKIDIEGAELDCLHGARETLARTMAPRWFVEIYLNRGKHHNARYRETFQLFWDHGYTCRDARVDGAVVGPADVDRWIAANLAERGPNFVFERTT